jgi:tetrapyrrole methylase family protein / MazG family protein
MKQNKAGGRVEVKKRKKTLRGKLLTSSLSPLSEACLISQKAAREGFDWPDITGVVEKLEEEMEEFKEALSSGDRKKAREELGDLLFVMVNAARFLKVHPEKALQNTVRKFKSRFRYVEEMLQKKGKSFRQSNLAEMEELWQQAKEQREAKGKHRRSRPK